MTTIPRPQLGEWRTFAAQIVKHRKGSKQAFNVCFDRHKIPVSSGVYIGFRTVHEGYASLDIEYGDYGGILSSSMEFDRKRSFVVWVFAINERKHPIFVLPEDATEGRYTARPTPESGAR